MKHTCSNISGAHTLQHDWVHYSEDYSQHHSAHLSQHPSAHPSRHGAMMGYGQRDLRSATSAGARLAAILAATFAITLAGCAAPPPAPPPAPPVPVGLADVLERPAERALAEGMRAYDDAQYPQAEAALRKALAANLRSPRDQASAHKLLAFITCTSDRLPDCEAAFAAARAAWPGFQLSKSEAGHPLWGPVARRVLP